MTEDQLREYSQETWDHVHHVQEWVRSAIDDLRDRLMVHDESKFQSPEREGFMRMASELKLAEVKYTDPEYREILKAHGPTTIIPHYRENDHHPEFYAFEGEALNKAWVKDGTAISRMNLMALIEMLCDWKAATLRVKDGDLLGSIEHNQERFGYDDQVKSIMVNTAKELGML